MGDRIAERLLVLHDAADELLVNVFATKDKLAGANKPFYLAEEKFSKLAQAFVKDFPDTSKLDKVAGFGEFMAKSKETKDTMTSYYDSLVNILDWNAAVISVLEDATKAYGEKIAKSESVRGLFMDLIVMFGRINVAASMIHDRKAFVAAYGRSYYQVECSSEPNYSKLGAYVVQIDYPFKFMTDVLKNSAKSVAAILETLPDSYMKVLNLQMLRKEGVLNLAYPPDKMAQPSDGPVLNDVASRWRYWYWIQFGYLLTPESLMDGNAGAMLKMALSDSPVLPIYRNLAVPMHAQFEWVIKNFKSKTIKLKPKAKLVQEAQTAAAGPTCWATRAEYRVYLRHELAAAANLLKDSPGLVGPKLTKIVALLQFAAMELQLYFGIGHSVPLKAKEKPEPEARLPEMLHHVMQILSLLRTHWKLVVDYALQYLNTGLAAKLATLMGGNCGAAGEAVGRLVKELRALNVETFRKGQSYAFVGLRANILRAECALLESGGCAQYAELLRTMRSVWKYSEASDKLGPLLRKVDLNWVMWYRDQLQTSFDAAIGDGAHAPVVASVFVRMCAYFHENGPEIDSAAKETIGKTAVRLAKQFVESIAKRVLTLMWEIAKNYLRYDNQLLLVNAAYPLLQMINHKFDKTFVPPVTPGTESQFGNRHELDALRSSQRTCWQLCGALNEFIGISVYNQQLVPREFLRDKLVQLMERFTGRAVYVTENDVVCRPSLLESSMVVFFGLLKQTETYLDLDMDAVLREFVLKNSWNAAVGDLGALKYDVVKDDADVWVSDKCYMRAYSKFYGEFVARRLAGPGVVYAPQRRAFVSKQNVAFQAEDYTQPGELAALARIGGPYGLASVDQKLLRGVLDHVVALKTILLTNSKMLVDVAKNYHKDISMFVKALKDMEGMAQRLVSIGQALTLRGLLQDALVASMSEPSGSSAILELLRSATMQYAPNTFMKPEFLEVDALATAAGLRLGVGDQSLKALTSKVMAADEKSLWEQLPVLCAMLFTTKLAGEAVYLAHVEGYSNNLHVAATAIHALIVASVVATSEKNATSEVVDALRLFLDISAVYLLNLAQTAYSENGAKDMQKLGVRSLPSLLVFLDLFVKQSDVLTLDMLDDLAPYILLRSMYRDIYSSPKEPAKKGDEWI